jgi:hypothetical protein
MLIKQTLQMCASHVVEQNRIHIYQEWDSRHDDAQKHTTALVCCFDATKAKFLLAREMGMPSLRSEANRQPAPKAGIKRTGNASLCRLRELQCHHSKGLDGLGSQFAHRFLNV